MAESNTTSNNEYTTLSARQTAAMASEMLDRHALENERALALAIVLRDRIESLEEESRDPTTAVLLQMLVDELGGAPEAEIQQCISALLDKCEVSA